MAIENVGAATTPKRAMLEPSKRWADYAEQLPTMRPDFYKSTVDRFKGDEARAKKWSGSYFQWLSQMGKDLMESLFKQ